MVRKLRQLYRNRRFQKGITGLETAIILIAFVVVAAVFAYTVLSAGLFSTQKSSEAVYNGISEASNTLVTRGSLIAYEGDTNIASSVAKVEFTVSTSSTEGDQTVDLTPSYALASDSVASVSDSTPTASYTSVPTVVFSGGDGYGASATAVLTGGTTGTISGFTITSAGSGYTSAPTVTLVGGGVATRGQDSAIATLGTGSALTLNKLNTPTQISFTDNTVSVPQCAWTLSWIGKHSSAYLLNPGEQAVITVWLHDYDGTSYSAGTTTDGFIASDDVGTYHTFNLEVKTASGAVLTLQRTTPALIQSVMDLN